MWLEHSWYGEYHKVQYKTLAWFQILDPKEPKKIALFSQESQNEGSDVPLFKSAKVLNCFL